MQKKPTYNLSTLLTEDFVKIVITGEVTRDDVKIITDEIYKMVKLTNSKKLLCDIRGVKGHFGYTEYVFFRNKRTLRFF